MAKKLPKAARDKIHAAVDDLFDKLKVRFIGPQSVSKRLFISFSREKSMPGMFEAAHAEERGIPDREHLDQLLRTAENYIEALRHKTKAQTVVAVQNFMHDVAKHRRRGAEPPNLHTVLGGELSDVYAKVKADVRRILDTETQTARNVGTLEGITRANASMGIEDPVVFFVVVRDEHLCDECKRLHLMPDRKTPRLWRMSEIGHDYHKRGEEQPKVAGLHPHCRCSMTTLMPGFGFDAAGMVVWKKEGHDELARQRGESLKKSQDERLFQDRVNKLFGARKRLDSTDKRAIAYVAHRLWTRSGGDLSPANVDAHIKAAYDGQDVDDGWTWKDIGQNHRVRQPVAPDKLPDKTATPLAVLHTTSPEAVTAMISSGHIPAPSLAVLPVDRPFSSFGPITFVARPHLADPQQGAQVFGEDAYTPRAPRTEDHTEAGVDAVVQAMNLNGDLRGREHGIRRDWLRQFKSVDEILAAAPAFYAGAGDSQRRSQLEALAPFVGNHPSFPEHSFGARREAMQHAVRAGKPLTTALKEHGLIAADSELGALRSLLVSNDPARYFEAKVPRKVNLGEFHGAVVPVGTSPEIKAGLQRHGLEVVEASGGDHHAAVQSMVAGHGLHLRSPTPHAVGQAHPTQAGSNPVMSPRSSTS